MSGFVKLLFGVIVLAIAVMMYPPLRLSALVLAGRSPVCPLGNAVHAEENQKRQIEIKDEILKASKMVAKDDKFEQWQTPMGTYWIASGSRYVLPFNLAEQKRKIYGSGPNFVRAGDIVLDCGANIGVFVREALNAGAKTVVAIEPAPENIEALKRNFQPEIASGRVIVYPKGVWDKDDFLTLHIDDHNSAADSFLIQRKEAHETDQKFPLTTIDKLVAELNLPRVDFIKMDIEGAEVKALNGGRATIAKHHPRMALSAYHNDNHPVEVPNAVKAAWDGYTMECGPCAVANNRIRPDILYFR
ncbi:MAG TPA: FkbM family methyltransferase [Bryobacteraceae bacterium]|nr:FkbM family methyltransferase [Bryobacteraceae bacterium]